MRKVSGPVLGSYLLSEEPAKEEPAKEEPASFRPRTGVLFIIPISIKLLSIIIIRPIIGGVIKFLVSTLYFMKKMPSNAGFIYIGGLNDTKE